MEKAKVYFTDFRTKANGDGLPTKLKNLIKKAGLADLDLEGKFVAIKMHFGELGNISYLRPNYARAVVDVVKELGGRPFLTDCNTLYPGSRKNALEHLYCAWENGFTPLTVGCPIHNRDVRGHSFCYQDRGCYNRSRTACHPIPSLHLPRHGHSSDGGRRCYPIRRSAS